MSDFNSQMARKLQNLKSDLGATKVRQGYKGTGAKSHRRQIWVDFPNDDSIDLWLEADRVGLGGVCHTRFGQVPHNGRTVEQVYADVCQALKPLAGGK